jgi:hypothetical protein
MVILQCELVVNVLNRDAIICNIVSGLDIEGLLDFRVWGNKEMYEDENGKERRKEDI